jgi:hypothetical protein
MGVFIGFRILGCGFCVLDFGFWVLGFGCQVDNPLPRVLSTPFVGNPKP